MSPSMESEKLFISRGNARTSAYPTDRALPNTSGRAMPNDLSQKSPPSILHRFRALLKQRDDEFRVAGDDAVPPPSTEEIVHLYELMLSELTFNSKPIITDLTVLAEEQREHGKGIADSICARILEVPIDQKLPSLYLLDSIVKNIGREYISYFSSRLPEVFCEAYRQVHPNLHHAMRHLFGTWSTVFPVSILRKIEAQLQISPLTTQDSSGLTSLRASESPRPTHGIHVNPKYLRQLEHSVVDKHIQDARGTSALQVYDQKPAGYEEYDYDHAEVLEHGGTQAFSSVGSMNHESFTFGTNKANIKLAKSSLSSRIGPNRPLQTVADELEVVRASPSHHVYDYEASRMIDGNEDKNKWRRKQYLGDNLNGLENTASYNLRNGRALEGPRALIEAYGSDKGKGYVNDNQPQIEHFSISGIDNKVAPVTWQNTEEEEFDWEDMSITFADRGRSNDMLKPHVPPLRFRTRLGFDRSSDTSLELGLRSNWSSQAQLPTSLDSSTVAEDPVPLVSDSWNIHSHPSQRSQNLMNTKGTGRNFQMPSLGRGRTSPGSEKMSLVDKLPTTDSLHRPPTSVSRLGSSSLDYSMEPQSVVQLMGPSHPANVHNSCPPTGPPNFPAPKHTKSQFESVNGSNSFINRPNRSSFMPEQQMSNFRNKEISLTTKLPQAAKHHAGRIPLTQGNQLQTIPLKPQVPPSQDTRDNFTPSAVPPVLPHLMAPSLSIGYGSQGHRPGINKSMSSSASLGQWNPSVNNIPSNLHLQGGTLPPLPPGSHPATVQTVPVSQTAGSLVPGQQPGTAFSGLINSLMAQGLISLNNQASGQDSVGLEFNPDVLKVRHESAIAALYADLPRQCMTCGLRFKTQEEHSNHMDWHVTKNRMSKSRKQKPSRKWFVNSSMWLSGAEALGVEAVPGFLPAEIIVEKRDDEELAVPADEDQNACALCGEPFEDFYSDETEEWMYKGAVYMNAPDGQTAGMDKSQLGAIVHAKCRSESNVVPPENFDQDDQGGNNEEGSQRKRLRS